MCNLIIINLNWFCNYQQVLWEIYNYYLNTKESKCLTWHCCTSTYIQQRAKENFRKLFTLKDSIRVCVIISADFLPGSLPYDTNIYVSVDWNRVRPRSQLFMTAILTVNKLYITLGTAHLRATQDQITITSKVRQT